MKKELPSKFRFKANGFYYLAELSTQADVYALSQTDEKGKDIRNLNNRVLKESVPVLVESGHWKIIEEPFELPSKFTFIVGVNTYTAIEQEDKSYMVYWKNSDGCFDKYGYTRESVKYHLEEHWTIEKEVDMSVIPVETVLTPEPTLLDDIEEFVNKTSSQIHFQSAGSFYIQSGFLGTDFTADNKEELKQLIDALTVLWNIVNGKK